MTYHGIPDVANISRAARWHLTTSGKAGGHLPLWPIKCVKRRLILIDYQ